MMNLDGKRIANDIMQEYRTAQRDRLHHASLTILAALISENGVSTGEVIDHAIEVAKELERQINASGNV